MLEQGNCWDKRAFVEKFFGMLTRKIYDDHVDRKRGELIQASEDFICYDKAG